MNVRFIDQKKKSILIELRYLPSFPKSAQKAQIILPTDELKLSKQII